MVYTGVKYTPDDWKKFLKALKKYGQINAAAVDVGITRKTVYEHMKTHPDFAEQVKESKEAFGGTVRQRTVRMAEEGNLKANVLLEQLANHEDFPKAQAALGGGVTVIVAVPLAQRLDQMQVAEHYPVLDVPSRVVE